MGGEDQGAGRVWGEPEGETELERELRLLEMTLLFGHRNVRNGMGLF